MKRFTHIVLLTVLLIPAVNSQGAGSRSTESQDAFDRLLALEGTWIPKNSNGDFRIVFEAISGNTVLLETWIAGSSKHSITVYHLDNDRVIATHYCPQGNQPRLELNLDGTPDKLDFTYFDATSIENENESYQHNLSFDFRGPDKGLERSETYITAGVAETDSLILARDE